MQMKTVGRVAAFLLLCVVLFFAPWAIENAVVDVREQIKPKETRWKGVISVGVVPTFSMESAGMWLETCGKAFARENSNVLVTVREMTKAGVQAGAVAQTLPDVLIFGSGVFEAAERETICRMDHAQPVAAGAYALLGNRELLEKAGWQQNMGTEETLALAQSARLRVAVPRRDYADPLAALQCMGDVGDAAVQDLYARVWPDFALEEKYALYVATQREILRMCTLQKAGRGFETVLIVPEEPLGAEQTLLCAPVRRELTARLDNAAGEEWILRWGDFLEEEAQQAQLASAGLFAVGGNIGLYEEGHPLRCIEEMLQAQGPFA